MSRQPEARLYKRIKQQIEARGGRCFKIQGDDSSFQEVGIPDLLCCYKGFFLGLEVKLPGEEASPVQEIKLRQIQAAGGVAEVVTSTGEVLSILAILDRRAAI